MLVKILKGATKNIQAFPDSPVFKSYCNLSLYKWGFQVVSWLTLLCDLLYLHYTQNRTWQALNFKILGFLLFSYGHPASVTIIRHI